MAETSSLMQTMFLRQARPLALAKELASSPELAIETVALLAAQGSEGALERVGFDAKALGELAFCALKAGMRSEADQLAEACQDEKPEVAQALCQAYEASLAKGSYHRWEPSSYGGFFEFHHRNPSAAKVWIRSEALKISGDDFWDHVERHHEAWEDPASQAALAARVENFALGCKSDSSPSWRAMEKMGPMAFEGMCQGLGRAGAWEPLCSAIECCEGRRDDVVQPLLRGCLDALNAKPVGIHVYEAICALASISPQAACELAKKSAHLEIQISELGGELREPSFPVGHPENGQILSAFSWSSKKNESWLGDAPNDLPDATLTVAELVAQWGAGEVGAVVLELTQFANTAKAQATRSLLEKLPTLQAKSGERAAVLEAIALRQISCEPGAHEMGKSPRL